MLNRLLQVVRVFVTRPWVWLMTAVALFQVFPAWMVTRGNSNQSTVSALPEVVPREPAIRRFDEFLDLAERGELATAKSVDLGERPGIQFPSGPFRVTRDASGQRSIELAAVEPGAPPWAIGGLFDELGILSHLRDVTDLRADLHMFSSDSLKSLGELQKLEALSLRHAGSTDSASLKRVDSDLREALSRLTALKRLDLQYAFGMSADVPPLPNLEFLAIGPTLHLEKSLRTVAEHSPRLSTLVLIGYPQQTLTAGEREALRTMPGLRSVYVEGFTDSAATRERLRVDLPGVWFPRSVYHPRRVFGTLYLVLGAMFPHMILWMQSLVCFSLGTAQFLPRFRGAHLAVPFAVAVVTLTAGMGIALWLGIAPLPALVILLAGAGIPTNPQPLVDLTPRGTWILRILVTWRVVVLLSIGSLVFLGKPTLDAFLLGEYPGLAAALLAVDLAAWCWTIPRLLRQARVLAEVGQPLIPGLVHVDQFSMQPVTWLSQKPERTDPGENWSDRSLERLLSTPRKSLPTLLRGGSPGVVGHIRVIVIAFMFVAMTFVFRPHVPGDISAQLVHALPFAGSQGAILFLGWVYLRWIGRRQVLSHELLRPVSRGDYYRGLWKATSFEMAQILVFLLVIGMATLFLRRMGPLPWVSLFAGTAGLFLVLHGFLMWMLTARRLWIPLVAAFAMITIVFPFTGVVIAASVSPAGPSRAGSSPAILIGVPLLGIAFGVALQLWQRWRWERLELG